MIVLNTSRVETPPERPDRVVINAGLLAGAEDIPLTGAEATALGWRDPFRCFTRQHEGVGASREGRFFVKPDSDVPYLLVYTDEDGDDALLSIYLFSVTEMPPPWQHLPTGLINVKSLNFEHWALPVFFRSHEQPCGRRAAAGQAN